MDLIHPASKADVVDAVRDANASSRRLLPVGGRRHLDKGNPTEIDAELWTTQLDRLVTDNRRTLETMLADFDVNAETLQRRLPELNELLAFVGPAVDGLARSTRTGPWIDSIVAGNGLAQVPDIIEEG